MVDCIQKVEEAMKVGDLVRCTYGSGSGTVGIIVAFTDASYIVQLNNGEYYTTHRLEVLSASR